MKHPKKPRLRLVGYARVSTDSQADRGVSLASQVERITAHAKAMDAELIAVHQETASGRLPPERRPHLSRALALVRSGEADGLLTLKLDRVSRRMRDAVTLLDESARKGWRLIATEQSLDTGSPMGRFVANMMSALAQMEAEQISENTKRGLAQVARSGRARSRCVPYGYRTRDGGTEQVKGDRRQLALDHAEQAVLKRIAALRKRGLGARRIAHALNKAKLLTRSGQPWTFRRVRKIVETVERRAEIAA